MRDSIIGTQRQALRRGRSWPSCASQRKCAALDFLGYLIIGVGNLLVAQAIATQAPAGPPAAVAAAPGGGG